MRWVLQKRLVPDISVADANKCSGQERPKQGCWVPSSMPNRRSTSNRRFGRNNQSCSATLPRKQIGGEVRCGLARPTRRDYGARGRIWHDHLAVEMPGRVAEQGDHDGEPEEERQRSQDQQCG